MDLGHCDARARFSAEEGAVRADCHVHTCFSDGADTPRAMAEAAERAGLDVLVITDHLTLPSSMDPDCVCSVPEGDLARWREEVREAGRGLRVQVVLGAECDYYEGCEAAIERWAQGCAVRLGSVHWAAGVAVDDPDDLSGWRELGPDAMWGLYTDAWCRACESSADFDGMAHPDLAFRFANEGFRPTRDLRPLFSQMAECAHDTGRRVELSTAGLRKSVGDYYPSDGLLERFRHAEVPLYLGSDAHRTSDVAWGLREAAAHAYEHGYRSLDVPTADGEWRPVAL